MRVLLSYHYYKDVNLDELLNDLAVSHTAVDIMADSGAFSAFTLGKQIDIDRYAQWVKYWSPLLTAYANLDVIGDSAATLDNQTQLEGMGLKPLPIFHTGDAWSYLDTYLDKYSYIMLGGMVPYSTQKQKLMPWLLQCFKRANNKAVYHGLGLTSWYALSSFPWYSVDSSSWGAGYRYGRVPVFNSNTGKMLAVPIGNKSAWNNVASTVRSLGFNPAIYADRNRAKRADLAQLGAASYTAVEKYLRRRHGPINLKDRTGLNMYLVDANADHLVVGADGIRIYHSPGGNKRDLNHIHVGTTTLANGGK